MFPKAMISVIIPTLNAQAGLAGVIAAVAGAHEIIVSDGGSADATRALAEAAGARVVIGAKGRGGQLRRGAAAAAGDWLLFLHADTALEETWTDEAEALMTEPMTAGVFTLAFDRTHPAARVVAAGANLRTRIFRLPYGDQGLLISRAHYDAVGGFADMPLFEDVDIVDRIVARGGRRALRLLKSRAVTSALRYERRGYARQVLSNWTAILRYRLGVPADEIARGYGE
ncbi:MAG: TIGR04283 family arsenosugar biosynthesis glycosyltransferase [Parvularculaceae bacterium]|nr:TIGR04283 family arsenosugar biosynthesis glycosyltransferase [Parvularculaceae bacterium]